MIITYVSNGLFRLLVGKEKRAYMIFDMMRGVKIAVSAYIETSEFHVIARDAEMLVFDCKNSPRY